MNLIRNALSAGQLQIVLVRGVFMLYAIL